MGVNGNRSRKGVLFLPLDEDRLSWQPDYEENMKKDILTALILLFFSVLTTTAQPTLSSNNNPLVGESYYYRVTDTIAQPGPSGSGQTWNYTGVQVTLNTVIVHYVAPSSTPYAGSFPGANLASYVLPGEYNYYTTGTGGFAYKGRGTGSDIASITGSNYLLLSYPLAFGSNYTNSISGTTSVATISGTVNVQGDGTGTLRLPSITYNNVLRVKVTEDIVFSFGPGVDEIVHTESYYWYNATFRGPLMRIITSTTSGISSAYSKSVGVADFGLGVDDLVRPSLGVLRVFPSPATTSANIELEVLKAGNTEFAILDLTGKEVQRWNVDLTPGTYTHRFDVASLPRGIYLLSARGEGMTREQRLILE